MRVRRLVRNVYGLLGLLSAGVLAGVGLPGSAWAGHAGYPLPHALGVEPTNAAMLVVGTDSAGFFVSRDAGVTWGWVCQSAIGYADAERRPVAVLPGPRLVVANGDRGLAESPDGCDWRIDPEVAEGPWVDVEATEDGRMVALASRVTTTGENEHRVWSKAAAGRWAELGQVLPGDLAVFDLLTPSASTLFVSALGPSGSEILRSEDSGQSWQRLPSGLTSAAPLRFVARTREPEPRLFAIVDEAQVAGLVGIPGDQVVVSRDSGETWTELWRAEGDLSGAALSGDASTLLVGGPEGVYRAATDTLQFERASSTPVLILAASGERFYATSEEHHTGFTLGVSNDRGVHFTPLLRLCEVSGALACGADTSVARMCSASGEGGFDSVRLFPENEVCRTGDSDSDSGPGAHDPPQAHSGEAGGSCRVAGPFAATARATWLGLVLVAGGLILHRLRRASR